MCMLSMAQNEAWKNDQRSRHDLNLYVSQNLMIVEILDYVKRDFGVYEHLQGTRYNIHRL